jgi:hypothetical protein
MKLVSLFLGSICLYLSACATSPSSSVQLQQYLQGYIGQSSQRIMQNFDLSTLGYAPAQLVKHNQEVLIYSIPRTVNIPIPIPQAPNSVGEAPIYIPSNSAQQYSTDLSCRILFQLKNDIATSVQYSQRTC